MESDLKLLDFLIIGAQKSATTTLFEYLHQHPEISMPAAKEVPFFTNEECSVAGWKKFSAEYFSETGEGQLRGKATPQYMADPSVPQRIHALFPETKLIAILRDPIDRAWSHYLMDQRREAEQRGFDIIIDEKLKLEQLLRARKLPVPLHKEGYRPESDFYITWGEYGRILSQYLKYFGREQMLLLSMSELKSDPQTVVNRIMKFLDLSADYVPCSLGTVAHRGGGQAIVSRKFRQKLVANPLFNAMWSSVPELQKQNIRYWFDQKNVKASNDERRLSESTENALRQHFAEDLELLVASTGFDTDWLNKYVA